MKRGVQMGERKVKTVAIRDIYKVPRGLFYLRGPNISTTECCSWSNYDWKKCIPVVQCILLKIGPAKEVVFIKQTLKFYDSW